MPCFDCRERHTACWADCEKYKTERAKIDARNEERARGRDSAAYSADAYTRAQRILRHMKQK